MKKTKFWVFILFIGIFLSIFTGRYRLSFLDTFNALIFNEESIQIRLLYQIRLPRILFACIAGGALAISGLVFQTIFKNGLASGDVLGTSSGCSLGAIIGILFFDSFLMTQFFTFIFGMFSLALVFFLSQKQRGNQLVHLLVCGIIVQAMFTSLITGLKLTADPFQELGTIEYWLMGGLSDVGWKNGSVSCLLVGLGSLVLYKLRWQIQMIGFGEEASTMGVNVKMVRTLALSLSTLLISAVVAVSGPISWVGILIPHMIRLWTHRPISKSFTFTFVIGAVFVLLCDTIARSLFAIELPISIVTSFFGAIYLMVIFRKGKRVL